VYKTFIAYAILWLLFILIHSTFLKKPRNVANILEIITLYFLIIFVGINGILGFLGHTLNADKIATQIGWATGSGFQFEVAVANLAFGVLGIVCIWLRKNFWLATAMGYSIFLFGAAYGHIREIALKGNYSPLNTGVLLYVGDMIIPTIALLLTILYIKYSNRNQA